MPVPCKRDPPSVRVPLPNSSNRHNDREVACLKFVTINKSGFQRTGFLRCIISFQQFKHSDILELKQSIFALKSDKISSQENVHYNDESTRSRHQRLWDTVLMIIAFNSGMWNHPNWPHSSYLSIIPTWCRSIINVDCSAVISLLPIAQNILLQ